MSDEPEMPEVARRKGAKDTLFSADWYDDDDEFGGVAGEVAKAKADAKSSSGQKEATFEPKAEAAPKAESTPKKRLSKPVEEESGSSPILLIVGVLAVGLLLGGGLVAVAGGIAVYLFLL